MVRLVVGVIYGFGYSYVSFVFGFGDDIVNEMLVS